MTKFFKKSSPSIITCIFIFINSAYLTGSSSINSMFTTRSLIPTSKIGVDLIVSIASGTQIAFEQCQKAFEWDRWNCPVTTFARRFNHRPTKELAYAQAIISAGIVHTITKNCSKGQLEYCGCDPALITNRSAITKISKNNASELGSGEKLSEIKWHWGGCSDHVEFASTVAQEYLDDFDKNRDHQSYAHLHNNKVGREIVKNTMVKRCICHGVSGSCALQTCWMQMEPFEVIARKLKEKYVKANRIETHQLRNSVQKSYDLLLEQIENSNNNELMYLEESPDYCMPDKEIGWLGTKGRVCSRNKNPEVSHEERKSCRNICRACGHKVRKQKRVIGEKCNCEFKWCCEVNCHVCNKTVEEFYCH